MYDISQVQSEYKTKLIDAEFAASLVKSNYRLHFGVGTGSSIAREPPQDRHPPSWIRDTDRGCSEEQLT